MTVLLTFALGGLVTFGLRSTMIFCGGRLSTSQRAELAIGLISPAVLSAIVASSLFLNRSDVALPASADFLAVVLGGLAAHRTKNISMALLVGLPTYWLACAVGLG